MIYRTGVGLSSIEAPGAGAAPSFVGPYDAIPNIVGAYGMRRLLSAYTGNLLRLRRSSDNAEQNFGYITNGDLDTAAIVAFVGGGSGSVVTWYDQSGNGYNAAQTTVAMQPIYVASRQNGKPVINVYAPTDQHLLNSTNNPVTAGSAYSVIYGAVAALPVGGALFCVRRTGAYSATMAYGDGPTFIFGDGVSGNANVQVVGPGAFKTSFYVGSHLYTGANNNPTFFVNGVSEPVLPFATYQTTESGDTGFFIGRNGAGQNWPGDIAELVVASATWSAAQRQAAEAALNDYWQVY